MNSWCSVVGELEPCCPWAPNSGNFQENMLLIPVQEQWRPASNWEWHKLSLLKMPWVMEIFYRPNVAGLTQRIDFHGWLQHPIVTTPTNPHDRLHQSIPMASSLGPANSHDELTQANIMSWLSYLLSTNNVDTCPNLAATYPNCQPYNPLMLRNTIFQ